MQGQFLAAENGDFSVSLWLVSLVLNVYLCGAEASHSVFSLSVFCLMFQVGV